jgi:hypothetical protein
MYRLKMEEDKLNLEQQDAHGKMKAVFEKRIQLYKRYLKEDGLRELERIKRNGECHIY